MAEDTSHTQAPLLKFPYPMPNPEIKDLLKLSTFTFEVVTVDEKGNEISRNPQEAEYFAEKLDDHTVLEMVKVLGGMFMMGSPDDEIRRDNHESPQHLVTVPPFFMGKYPITQAQWKFVAELPQVEIELNTDPSHFKGGDRPVECVSWHDATEFCRCLSTFTGRTYRLPSEAEWEYACRAGTDTPFHLGKTITTDLANYCGTDDPIFGSGSYGQGPKGVYREETTPVGHFGVANAFGLYDMHGNVREWCEDHWHRNYEGAPSDGSAWLDAEAEAEEDECRIRRGGSWINHAWDCRSASRYVYVEGSRYFNLGFRVVCSSL